jgi:phage I-like protein
MDKIPEAPAATHAKAGRVAVVALDIEIKRGDAAPPGRIRVIPDGVFDSLDGRPGIIPGVTAKAWRMDAAIAAAVIEDFRSRGVDLPIDYEHQSLKSADNGRPAPAAGWITGLSYVAGRGLFADVRWTDAAAAHLIAGEYRYISPVFFFDPETGAVTRLHSAALTNTPALGALGEIAALVEAEATKRQSAPLSPVSCLLNTESRAAGLAATPKEPPKMDKTKMLAALGLPLDTGDDSALAALADVVKRSNEQAREIADLKTRLFDPEKHVPMDEHKKLAAAHAALQESVDKAEHERLMSAALADARILPPNEAYWRAQPLAALQAFLKDAKPLAALAGTQTGGKPPATQPKAEDSAAIAQAALKYQAEQARDGIVVTTAAAVEHVTTKGA